MPSLSSASTTSHSPCGPLRSGADVGDVAADDEARTHPGLARGSASASRWSWSCRGCRRRRATVPAHRSTPACPPGSARSPRWLGPRRVRCSVRESPSMRSRRRRRGRVRGRGRCAPRRPRRGPVRAPDGRGGRSPTPRAPSRRGRWRPRSCPGPPTPTTWRRWAIERSSGGCGGGDEGTARSARPAVRVSMRVSVRVSMPVASAEDVTMATMLLRHARSNRPRHPNGAPRRGRAPRRPARRDEAGRRGGRRVCRRAGRVRSLAA